MHGEEGAGLRLSSWPFGVARAVLPGKPPLTPGQIVLDPGADLEKEIDDLKEAKNVIGQGRSAIRSSDVLHSCVLCICSWPRVIALLPDSESSSASKLPLESSQLGNNEMLCAGPRAVEPRETVVEGRKKGDQGKQKLEVGKLNTGGNPNEQERVCIFTTSVAQTRSVTGFASTRSHSSKFRNWTPCSRLASSPVLLAPAIALPSTGVSGHPQSFPCN